MRDWSETINRLRQPGLVVNTVKALREAIAEIEILRADVAVLETKMDDYYKLKREKAELVEALTILDALMDFSEELEPGGYYCYVDTAAVNRACKTAHQLLAKLEGGEPNAKS
jgi:hypothetical protein